MPPVRKRTLDRLAWLIVLAACAWPVQAKVSISPAYVDVDIDRGHAAGRFKIANLGDEEERYRLNAAHFSFSVDGNLLLVEPDEHSAAGWIRFNPREFTLPAKTERVVRFAIVRPRDARPGEYWAGIELESLKIADAKFQRESASMNIKVVSSILVPVFGKLGSVLTSGAVRDVRLGSGDERPVLVAVVENTGSGRLVVKGQYVVRDGSGAAVAEGAVGHGYILRELERRYEVPLEAELPAGEYTISVKFTSPQLDRDLERDVTITWEP